LQRMVKDPLDADIVARAHGLSKESQEIRREQKSRVWHAISLEYLP